MKFRAERTQFADAATWVLRTVGDRARLPEYGGVSMKTVGDRLELASTDGEASSALAIPVQAERDGAALVPGRLLGDVVRSLPPAAVEAEVTDDRLLLNCGRAKFNLRLIPNPDLSAFPAPGSLDDSGEFALLKAEEFAQTVSQVARAASADTARPLLTGVQLEASADQLVAVATDSYRLAMRTVAWEKGVDATVLVPRRAMEEARRSAEQVGSEVRLELGSAEVTFGFADRLLRTRLIEGNYPPVRQLIPDGFERRLVVDRASLIEVVKRVSVVGDASTTTTPVTLDLTADTVRVTAGSGEAGEAEESMPGEFEGEPMQIAFNPRYLTDGLDAAGGERVILEFRDELKPAVIRPSQADDEEGTSDYLYLLMPVRL
jgi:DNA polymerase III subunit beta